MSDDPAGDAAVPDEGGNRPTAAEVTRTLRWSALAYALVCLALLFFFYDAFNLNDSIYAASLLSLGITPYSPPYASTITAGYPILAYNQLMTWAYASSGFSPFAAALAGKVILAAAGFGAAYVLLRIALREGVRAWKLLYLSLLFNPFLLFVNEVWTETDVLIILAVLVGFYFLRFRWEQDENRPSLVVGVTALVLASFTYVSPFFLLPAFVVYSGTRRRAGILLAGLLALGAVYAVPVLAFGLNPLNVRPISSGAAFDPYSVLSLFLPSGVSPSTQLVELLVVVAAAVAIVGPIVLRHWRVPLATTLIVVYATALVLAMSLLEPDNLVIFAGLVPLALVFTPRIRVNLAKILLLESALVPVLWIANQWNGPGVVTGVYYWSYFWVQRNVSLYLALGGATGWKSALLAYPILLGAAGAYLALRGRAPAAAPSLDAPMSPPARSQLLGRPFRRRENIVALAVVASLLAVPAVGVLVPDQSYQLTATGTFPSEYFVVHDFDVPSLYLMPGPRTFSLDPAAGTATISAASPNMGFSRVLGEQRFDVDVQATIADPADLRVGSLVGVVNASSVIGGFATLTSLTPAATRMLTPLAGANLSVAPGDNLALANTSPPLATNGSGVRTYSLDPLAFDGQVVVFAARMSSYARAQNILWVITQNLTAVAEAYFVGQSFYVATYGEGGWVARYAGTPILPGDWFVTGFSFPNASTISAFVDSVTLSVPAVWHPESVDYLYAAKFGPSPLYDGTFALIGELTDLYVAATGSLGSLTEPFVTVNSTSYVVGGPSTTATFDYAGTPSTALLTVDGRSFVASAPLPVLYVGKLSDLAVQIDLYFAHISFAASAPSRPLPWVVVEFGVSLPLASSAFYWCARWRRPP